MAGETFPLSELLGAGTSTQVGDNFVDKARGKLEKIRDQVATLIDLFEDDQTQLNSLIGTSTGTGTGTGKWKEAQANSMFGPEGR